MPLKQIVLGSRGSELALVQAGMAERTLCTKFDAPIRVEIIQAGGDESVRAMRRVTDEQGRKGIFTAALEEALFDRRIDVAVHSAKDLPSTMDSRLTIAAVLPRGSVHDVLITKTGNPLAFLGHRATIATGSIRRQRQLSWVRPDFIFSELRGNVPTRLSKFLASTWDGIVLATAGLERLDLRGPRFKFEQHELYAEALPIEIFVPAGGQGVIALQTRAEDTELYSSVDDHSTHICLDCEREFLRLLQGDCNLPVGAYARFQAEDLELRAQVFGDAAAPAMGRATGTDPNEIARAVFEKISRPDHAPARE